MILLGSRGPLEFWPTDLADRLRDERIAADLKRVGVVDPMDLLTFLVMDERGLTRFAGEGERNTDDNCRIEFEAPKNLLQSTTDRNAEAMILASDGPWPQFEPRIQDRKDQVAFLIQLGEAWERRERWAHAGIAYEEAKRRAGSSAALEARIERMGRKMAEELKDAER